MAAHSHGFEAEFHIPHRTRWMLYGAAAALALLTIIGMVILRPTGENRPDLEAAGLGGEFYDGTVVALDDVPCPGGDESLPASDIGAPAATEQSDIRCANATFELVSGPDAGEEVEQELFDLDSSPPLGEGTKVVMRYDPRAGEGFQYQFAGEVQRKPTLFWLAVLFAVVVVALGRLRGLAALAGLVGSLVVLLVFILPSIIDGNSPLLVAIVGSSAIVYLALYLAHGFSPMTTVALLGTLGALVVTAVLGIVFVDLASFSGVANEEAFYLNLGAGTIDLRGLVLAGVIIGALGAIDDMTVTQASAVWELHAANPELGRFRLYRSAMKIGRDHIASTVNTLVLAYAGASMPLLILFVLSTQSLGTVANSEIVATEIVRTLVGSIGLVAAVPVTTWLAAIVAPEHPETRATRRQRRTRQRDEQARLRTRDQSGLLDETFDDPEG